MSTTITYVLTLPNNGNSPDKLNAMFNDIKELGVSEVGVDYELIFMYSGDVNNIIQIANNYGVHVSMW